MPPFKHKPNLLIIIDDSSFDLRINSAIAERTKAFKKIVCFSTAQTALDFLIENINNDSIFPHLIFLDIQMPEMDGFEFMHQYDKFTELFKEKSFVIMLSSTDDISDIARVEANKNIVALLKKPLGVKVLNEVVANFYD